MIPRLEMSTSLFGLFLKLFWREMRLFSLRWLSSSSTLLLIKTCFWAELLGCCGCKGLSPLGLSFSVRPEVKQTEADIWWFWQVLFLEAHKETVQLLEEDGVTVWLSRMNLNHLRKVRRHSKEWMLHVSVMWWWRITSTWFHVSTHN